MGIGRRSKLGKFFQNQYLSLYLAVLSALLIIVASLFVVMQKHEVVQETLSIMGGAD